MIPISYTILQFPFEYFPISSVTFQLFLARICFLHANPPPSVAQKLRHPEFWWGADKKFIPGFERDTFIFAKVLLGSPENTNKSGVQAQRKAFIKCVYVVCGVCVYQIFLQYTETNDAYIQYIGYFKEQVIKQ